MLEPKAQHRKTSPNPDSRIMKRTGGGFDPSYIAQAAVDDSRIPARNGDCNRNGCLLGYRRPAAKRRVRCTRHADIASYRGVTLPS